MRSLADGVWLAPAGPAAPRRRVLHVCPYMHPFAGGPPVVVERLATLAPDFGWEASVVTTSFLCGDDGRALAADLGRRIAVEVLPIDRPRIMGRASRAAGAIDAAVRRADMVHVHTLWHPLNGVVRRACARHGKPYVLSPHGMLDPYSLSVRPWRKRAYLALLERRNFASAARLVFATETERDLAAPVLAVMSRADQARHDVVPLGADPPPAGSRAQLAARFLGAHPAGIDGRRLLFLARLHPKKGLERLLEAMPAVLAASPGAHLVVAGSGTGSYEESLRRHAARLGVASSVSFVGFLTNEDKWSAMAAADLFVLPSRQENFAIAVAEAMRAGLPVVVSRAVNISPAIAAAGAGIVLDDAHDAAALAAAIAGLLRDPAARDRAAESARGLAIGAYGWQEAAARSFALYDTVLSEREAAPVG